MIDPGIKFVAVVGPTATGKTALALRLASRFDGEIICADSRTLYRGMDIGTAKPTLAEQELVPHHLLNTLEVGEVLSAGAFKQLAEYAIADIAARGRLPLLVGGSGLYVDAVLYDYEFPSAADMNARATLEKLGPNELLEVLKAKDPEAFERIDRANRRRVIRAIETAGEKLGRREAVVPQALVIGPASNKIVVQKRIKQRVDKMLKEGFIREIGTLLETYGPESSAFDVIGYRAFKGYVQGTKTLAQAVDEFVRGDVNLYKKQVTWFKRNAAIQWVEDAATAEALVTDFLRRGSAQV